MGCKVSCNILACKPLFKFSRLEHKMAEALKKRELSRTCSFRTFNSVILKFPKLDESFEQARSLFQRFDEDSNGIIDLEELKKCLQELNVSFTDKEIKELYKECDMNENKGIDFKEFIVLLALIYLSLEDHPDSSSKQCILWNDLREAFDTVVDTFIYFDRNKDGFITKKEMIQALNEISPGQEAAGDIALKRFSLISFFDTTSRSIAFLLCLEDALIGVSLLFSAAEEMDWNKNGKISFKELLFAFTDWVGVENDGE